MGPLHAQNGTKALDKVVGKFQQSNGISATFTLTVFNALNEPVEKQNGTIKHHFRKGITLLRSR